VYIQSATLNSKAYNKSFITFEDVQNGGKLYFEMGNTPNKNWASEEKAVPYSLSSNSK
jgi:putative alpha-1,2-mannosidase